MSEPQPAPNTAQKLVNELKVTAHLMTFDAGLFCVVNTPGGAPVDPVSGLPGVRVSLPPGASARADQVQLTGFRDDGWLSGWDGAALVRVLRGPAQVLVTIYQLANTTADAPHIQILRIADAASLPPPTPTAPTTGQVPAMAPPATGAKAAPAKTAPPPAPAAAPSVPAAAATATRAAEIVAHVQTRGDVAVTLDEWIGTPGSKHWIEGFAIAPKGDVGSGQIEYQAVLGRGWLSPWAEGGQFCGSRGMSLPVLGLRVRLRGEAAEQFDCRVTASFTDGTRLGPQDNGEPCQAESLAPLEAFRIELAPRERGKVIRSRKIKT